MRAFARRFHGAATKSHTLDLVCYPYMRSQLKTDERRGWVSTIYARLVAEPGTPLAQSNLANKFVEFKEFQESFLSLAKDQGPQRSSLLSNVNIYFAPSANGRPTPFFKEAVTYDSKEHQQLVVPEQSGDPGDLFLLPALPSIVNQNLMMYFSHADKIGNGPTDLKAMNWIHFLFSGSPTYHFNNWDHTDGHTLEAGRVYDEAGGWRCLDALKIHDTVFFQSEEFLHTAIYLGGRLLLHKISSGGPIWISTFRELFELTGRWEKAHVKKKFKIMKAYEP